MNNNSLNYIVSGCSFSRITFNEAYSEEEVLSFIKHCFSSLQNAGENHKFSLLFNAWVEKNFGPILANYADSVAEIMSDSGGLQIVTQGKTVTEDIKKEVYKVQGTYSDTCLSFDDIPISFSGESSGRNDVSNRWFDTTRFEDCAKASGRNVRDQIRTFIDMESKSKPVFIVQGNDYETYMQWAELGLKEIPKEHHKYIEGFAMAGACLGTGTLEDIKRAFYFTQLPIDTNRLHLLGVGSIKRIAPFLIFSQNGLYNNLEVSYDSTTHSSGVVMGRTYLNDKILLFGRDLDETYEKIFNAFWNSPYFPDGLTLDLFHEIINTPSKVFAVKYGSRNIYIQTFVGFLSFTIANFIKHIEKCYTNKKTLLNLAKKSKERNVFNSLYQIKNLKDFQSWERNIGKSVKSAWIAKSKKESSNIEDLF